MVCYYTDWKIIYDFGIVENSGLDTTHKMSAYIPTCDL